MMQCQTLFVLSVAQSSEYGRGRQGVRAQTQTVHVWPDLPVDGEMLNDLGSDFAGPGTLSVIQLVLAAHYILERI